MLRIAKSEKNRAFLCAPEEYIHFFSAVSFKEAFLTNVDTSERCCKITIKVSKDETILCESNLVQNCNYVSVWSRVNYDIFSTAN